MRLISATGATEAMYTYDAWGKPLSVTDASGSAISDASHIANVNPIRYRGYYYDVETGFYYLQSRYYDPEVGRFINADEYISTGQGILGHNMFAYCGNNPIIRVDASGRFFLTALIVGAVVGAVIGGTVGGVAAYNSAKSSGVEGTDLFVETIEGVGKGAAVGTVLGGLAGATVGAVATCGAVSVAGTATITASATVAGRVTEVAALQSRKSMNDGDDAWQIVDDCVDSIFGNWRAVFTPIVTKAASTRWKLGVARMKLKVTPIALEAFLRTKSGSALAYIGVVYAWGQAGTAIFCRDPEVRARQRGYTLQ